MRKIPSTMVSQHPDHASKPYWHNKAFISTRHEVKEAFLSFSDLGASEYKWDWEGKYVDESVVEHLLSEHYDFFKKNQLGRDKFLTMRLPNPKVETEFRLGRAFMGLLTASGLAKQRSVNKFMVEYRGIRTVLLQSAFRYDYPKKEVVAAIKLIEKELPKKKAVQIPRVVEFEIRELIPIFELYYRKSIEGVAQLVNKMAQCLPNRRERVQHIGLFGYSRGLGKVRLPRAIGFTAVMYSLGVPPELVGTGRGLKTLGKLKKHELLEKYCVNIKEDLLRSSRYVNKEVISKLSKKSSSWADILEDIEAVEKYLKVELVPQTDEEKSHHDLTGKIYKALDQGKELTQLIEEAAVLRKSLG